MGSKSKGGSNNDFGPEPPSDKELLGGVLLVVLGGILIRYYWKHSSSTTQKATKSNAVLGKDKASDSPLNPLSSNSSSNHSFSPDQDDTSPLGVVDSILQSLS